jgi:GDP-L-fucose synthase
MIDAIDQGIEEVILWGDGSPTREFFYAGDAARGIVMAAERYQGSEPVNLGAGMEISIKDLANLIAESCGNTGKITWDTTKPNGQPRRALDTSRAKDYFGFEAEMPFKEGIQRTIAWYRENKHKIT